MRDQHFRPSHKVCSEVSLLFAGARVKSFDSKNLNQNVFAAVQKVFGITCNATKLALHALS